MPKERDLKIKKCMKQGIDLNTCGRIVDAIDHLDRDQDQIWLVSDEIKAVSEKKYEQLDDAYNNVGQARDWLRDIIGDVE